MATANTSRKYEIKADDSGLISVPVEVSRSDGSALEQRSFYLSTAVAGCTMRAADLQALGYDASAPAAVPFIRIGVYDFYNVSVEAADANVIGANQLKWLNFTVSNSEGMFDVDLIDRIKPLVEKGINPNIKPGALSRIKNSAYNDNGNWLTWEEIDNRYPNSWVLLAAEDEDPIDLGGEVLWCSDTENPDVTQEGTFLYCNKAAA
ncbi:MAG: hypothetical protein FWE68_01510, partial [Defluviitaleaceae bacterium]|nr:hypothetical protein [Defluviitaleaceae bacterium]